MHGGTAGGQAYAGFDTEPFRVFVLGFDLAHAWWLQRPSLDDRAAIRLRSGDRPPARGLRAGLVFRRVRSGRCGRQKSRINSRPACRSRPWEARSTSAMSTRRILLETAYSSPTSTIRGNCSGVPLSSRRRLPVWQPQEHRYYPWLSIPLGGDVTASSGASRDRSGVIVASDVTNLCARNLGVSAGGCRIWKASSDCVWRAPPIGAITARSRRQRFQSQSGSAGTISQEGAMVAAGGGVFFRQPDRRCLRDRRCRGARPRSILRKPAGRPHRCERQGNRANAERLPAQQDFHRSAPICRSMRRSPRPRNAGAAGP